MVLDGTDIQFLLRKKGYRYKDVAKHLNVSVQNINQVIYGKTNSYRVVRYIEKLLGFPPESLEITSEKRDELVKVA